MTAEPQFGKPVRILGIETSCDETGLALLELCPPAQDGQWPTARVLGQALHSQIDLHKTYGGVVPELASRDHLLRIMPLLTTCLEQANTRLDQVDWIAVTEGPGLAGALLVGVSVAHGLAAALNKPLMGIHHLEGHLLSPLLDAGSQDLRFPFLALLVSGGHTQIMRVDGVGQYTLLGETIDDAAGEAFDKSAQLLGLGYPGGPAIS
ncbi:MAG: tRNA (adenosine(37)-N6)-threonylcarbamoyltransferase complex transferase subunit TsaD, partial [Burkholderiaceae bacterium]